MTNKPYSKKVKLSTIPGIQYQVIDPDELTKEFVKRAKEENGNLDTIQNIEEHPKVV